MSYRFNPPPGWPQPPQGWRPPAGRQPDPAWPPAPPGWEFWISDEPAPGASAEAPGAGEAGAETPGGAPGVEQAPAAPAVDAGAAEDDAATAEQAVPATEQQDQPTEQFPEQQHDATEQFPAGAPTEQFPAGTPTEQFPAGTPTEQFPAQQQGSGWSGVPQQPGAVQGPAASAPQQWGTAPSAAGQQPGGEQPGGYSPAGGLQQPGPGQPGDYQLAGGQQPFGGYSAAPPPGSGPQFGGPSGSQQLQQSGPFGPGDVPQRKSRTPLIVGGIAGVVVLALLIVLAVRLIGGGDDEAGGGTPSPTAPVTSDPTDDPTSADPTDDPTSADPTDDPTDSQQSTGDIVALAPGEAAEILSVSGEPELTAALVSVERNWEPDSSQAVTCPDPSGEHIALEFEFTTLSALAEGSETFGFLVFELGLVNANGTALEAIAVSGMFCLTQDQLAPSEVGPDETFTGWAVIDAPSEATMVTWEPFLDFSGQQPTYGWNLADF